MKYPTTLIIAALVCSTAVAAPEPVTCDSPCDCHNAHGEGRWLVKTDPSLPPTDASAIQAVTPSEMWLCSRGRQWTYKPPLQQIFDGRGEYLITIALRGSSGATRKAVLKFTWNDWNTSILEVTQPQLA